MLEADDDGDMLYPGRACLGPFRLDEDEVECSNDKCPQNDGGVCIESRDDCKRRVLEENKWDTPTTGIGGRRYPPRPSER